MRESLMPGAENAELLARYMDEVWNKANYDVAREVIADDMVVHGAGGQVVQQGPEGVIELIKTWRAAFPDARMTVHDIIVDGELAADRLTWEGTHEGDFYGIPATHRTVRCTSIGSDRIVDGRFTEGWGEVDMLGMMSQLGTVPAVFGGTTWNWTDAPGANPDPLARRRAAGGAGADPASREIARRTALRWFDALNSRDGDQLRAVVAPDFVDHNPATGGTDLAGELRLIAGLRASVPDLQIEPDLDHVIVDGDRVLVRWRSSGHHTGERLLGAEPTGAALEWTGSDIFRIDRDVLCERWVCADMLALAKQLGIVP